MKKLLSVFMSLLLLLSCVYGCTGFEEAEQSQLSYAESHEHTIKIISGKQATCTEKGLTEGKYCSECGEIIMEQKELDKIPHTQVKDEAVVASKIQFGTTEGIRCGECGEMIKQKEIVFAYDCSKLDSIKASLPFITYAFPFSGESKIYAYTDSTLETRTENSFDTYSAEIAVIEFANGNHAVKVAYSSGVTGWFYTGDILGVDSFDKLKAFTAEEAVSSTTRMSASDAVIGYGSIDEGDSCVVLGERKIGTNTYYPTVYPISEKSFNGVTGIKSKLAFTSVYVSENEEGDEGIYIADDDLAESETKWNIEKGTDAYNAILLINSKYSSKLTKAQKQGKTVFLFEGVGSNSSANVRKNAMCVVVDNGKITYVNRNCSTIPDYPFDPQKNEGTPMPTMMSGIYNYITVNHHGYYAALNISGAKVVRFRSKTDYYSSTSTAINVHRRSSDNIAAPTSDWVNSAGCQLIGDAGTAVSGQYAQFVKAMGLVSSAADGNTKYSHSVTGKIIIDRTYAHAYLTSVGYSEGAITLIG